MFVVTFWAIQVRAMADASGHLVVFTVPGVAAAAADRLEALGFPHVAVVPCWRDHVAALEPDRDLWMWLDDTNEDMRPAAMRAVDSMLAALAPTLATDLLRLADASGTGAHLTLRNDK